jgi:hypothetical protein
MAISTKGTTTKTALKNISEISEEYGIHRETVRTRLKAAGFKPHPSSTPKETKYIVTAALIAALQPNGIKASRETEKLDVDIATRRLKLEEMQGKLASVQEFADITNQIFGALYKKIALNMPSAITKKVRAAKTDAEGSRIMSEYAKKIFTEARENHKEFIK